VDTEEIQLLKAATGIVAALSPYNLSDTFSQLQKLQINTEDRLRGLVCIVYELAYTKQNYSKTLSQLCQLLARTSAPSDYNTKLTVDFASLLEKRCCKELISDYQFAEKIKRMRFFAELYNIGLLSCRSVLQYIDRIVHKGLDEENVRCLSRLLTLSGKRLDAEKESTFKLNELFASLEKAIQGNLNAKARLLLINVVELRANNWSPCPSYNQVTERKDDLEFYENKLAYVIPSRFSMKFKKNILLDRMEVGTSPFLTVMPCVGA